MIIMIKNVVFDFGNVLIKYAPEYIVSNYVSDPEDKRIIREVLFDRLYWDKLDDNTITDEEVVRYSCERLPERLHGICSTIYYNWVHHLPAIPGMWELVSRIKREYGVKTFLLSNVGSYFVDFKDEFAVLGEMEKCIFSAAVGHAKPNADMFQYLTDVCGIVPGETLLVDDSQKNIDGAEAFGIHGYLFDGSSERLSEYLDKVLNRSL